LPDAPGLEAVRQVQVAKPRVCIVLFSSSDDELFAAQAIKEGAQDYRKKGVTDPRELTRVLLNVAERRI